jgi:hypothetical protein
MRSIPFSPGMRFAVARRWSPSAMVAATVAALLLGNGCAEKHAQAFPWATAITVRPHAPTPVPGYKPPALDLSSPDLPWDFPAPRGLTIVRQPARPRVPAPATHEPDEDVKTEAPSLAPQLSQQEIAAAQEQMNTSIGVARRNLEAASSHKLNATQSDLASKVNSFVEESKVAVKEGDWARARNLARKAQLLSDELASSL